MAIELIQDFRKLANKPADDPKRPNGPDGPPAPDDHPLNDYGFRWGITRKWMQRIEATEDDDSEVCGKGAICR